MKNLMSFLVGIKKHGGWSEGCYVRSLPGGECKRLEVRREGLRWDEHACTMLSAMKL